MKVFISWSGELSHRVAQLLHRKLQLFIQNAVPWISSEDIAKGRLWRQELAKELEADFVGIFCITRENAGSAWVNFEAGALAKSPDDPRVIPFLFEMRPSDVVGPLSDFQASIYKRGDEKNKDEFRKLIVSINARMGGKVPEPILNQTFEQMWPDFVQDLDAIAGKADQLLKGVAPRPTEPREVMEEILETVRDQRRMIGAALGDPRWTFRGNAKLDPLSPGDYRQLALGLAMLKTLAEIESKQYYQPPGAIVKTLLTVRDPMEVLLGRAYAPRIHSLYFDDENPEGELRMTYSEDEPI